jgi:hypothetical protein
MFPKLKLEIIDSQSNPGIRFPRALFQLTDRLQNWKDFWIGIFLPSYLMEVQQNFATEGDLVGGWPDLNPGYAAWKARHFPGRKILELTRRLRNSLMPGAAGSSGAGSDTVLRVGPKQLEIGTRVPYAAKVDETRQILVPIDMKNWTPIIREWIMQTENARRH